MSLDLKDFNFPKLGTPNSNNDFWFIKMKYLLQGKKLWSAIDENGAIAAASLLGAASSTGGEQEQPAQAAPASADALATSAQAKSVIALRSGSVVGP
jgi:hypothetical protein